MFRRVFSLFLWSTISCGVVHAAPNWKAPQIAKALKEADAIVEKAQLPVAAFPEAVTNPQYTIDQRDTEAARRRRDEVIAGLSHSSLCAQPYSVAMVVTSFVDQEDGSVQIIGSWTREPKGRVFYTPPELIKLDEWKRDWEENERQYLEALKRYNNIPRTAKRDPANDPARSRQTAVAEFNARRDRALLPIQDRARQREKVYSQVRLEVTVAADLAARLDRPKMLKARQVYVLVHPQTCDLALPAAELTVPPVISTIRGTATEIDAAMLKAGSSKP
jgi:hypothetical protein